MTSIVQSRLDALVTRCRREVDEGRLPGYQLAVGFENEIVYAEAYGDAADHNRFHTYSAVKPTVSLTVLELAAEGLLDVDATVASVLPESNTMISSATSRTESKSRGRLRSSSRVMTTTLSRVVEEESERAGSGCTGLELGPGLVRNGRAVLKTWPTPGPWRR